MKPLLMFLICAGAALAQPLTFGIKGGVPLTDFVNASKAVAGGGSLTQAINYQQKTKRYIVGPTVELKLPAGFSVELDALYRRMGFDAQYSSTGVSVFTQTKSGAWEFPLLLKYRFGKSAVRPYVDAGIAWDTLTGLHQDVSAAAGSVLGINSGSHPPELHKSTTTGFVMGAGLDLHALVVHISPEVRYTHWGSTHFTDALGALKSNKSQAEFLVGITF